jgi:hypothetical protein
MKEKFHNEESDSKMLQVLQKRCVNRGRLYNNI